MTDSALSSLFPTNQLGADGFNWFIGQIESGAGEDPKGSGRHRVRIVGQHPKTCNIVPTDSLGWAQTLMPVTNPHTPGGATSVSDQLESGTWVVGFFLDPDRQMPVIMGSIGRVANSIEEGGEDEDPTPGEDKCKEFTTFVKPKNKVQFDQFENTIENDTAAVGVAPDGRTRTTGDGQNISQQETIYLKAKYSQNTETNQGGINWCVEVADECGKETDMDNSFTRLFAEMLAETQRNDGKLGTYLVGKVSGELTDAVAVGRRYVTKAKQLVRTFVASVKGFVIEKMRLVVKTLTDALLFPDGTGNSLSAVTKFFNKRLDIIGCSMADLGDRLAEFIEDIIFGYLFNIYKQTACQIDKLIQGILSKMQSLMTDLLNNVLGPIMDVLGAIASPFNILGDAINYVLNLLGITCSGPDKSCSTKTTVCTNCGSGEREDFLDNLIDSLEDGPKDWAQYVCEDAYEGRPIPKTDIDFIGGIQEVPEGEFIAYSIDDIYVKEGDIAEFTVRRAGRTDMISSVSYSTRDGTALKDLDYQKKNGILGFVAGENEKTIQVRTYSDAEVEGREDFFVAIFKDTPGTLNQVAEKNIGKCVIRAQDAQPDPIEMGGFEGLGDSQNPTIQSINPNAPGIFPDSPIPDAPNGSEDDPNIPIVKDLEKTYSVVADKSFVKEGDFVTYTITTTNVPDGTVLSYQLFGDEITPQDIVSFTLTGTFTVNDNKSTVVVGINDDNNRESSEVLIFAINGTGAQASVLIQADIDTFSPSEKIKAQDSSINVPIYREARQPTVGEPITGPGGEILDIPVDDPGDPFSEAPAVFVTGNGFSAAAIALLDDNGYLTEIRVTDPGFGFKLNTPTTAMKECIIDSFTMIRPGRDYKTPPTVYLNGDPTIAEAVVENGQVISVRIKNREVTFDRYPEVLILGGGGYGATFLPSFSCLEPAARVELGSAKVGTGSYIDCP
jgi:hypothetical protein